MMGAKDKTQSDPHTQVDATLADLRLVASLDDLKVAGQRARVEDLQADTFIGNSGETTGNTSVARRIPETMVESTHRLDDDSSRAGILN